MPLTNLASLETKTGSFAGPQLKSPTNAPVEVSTAGTTPVMSISLTCNVWRRELICHNRVLFVYDEKT